MSLFGVERSHTIPNDGYDHAINLVDSTQRKVEPKSPTEPTSRSLSSDEAPIGSPLDRQTTTRSHLRKQLAQRKYAKWQDGKEVDTPEGDESIKDKFTLRSGRMRDKVPFRTKKPQTQHTPDQVTFVDVLYENQRGWWLCGVPLYSSNSLLHIDPAPWQTSTFHDSPVDITNAQVPDPSWEWAWRRWYVDMSHDVDEDGWQYSFSFGTQFAWHGNHPWFHSYARRRRWLRKRVKKGLHQGSRDRDHMSEAHRLNPDYFTIHPSRGERSRGSSADRAATQKSSFTDEYLATTDDDDDLSNQDIKDIAALLAALKRSIIDREKIAAVKTFLDEGEDELYYLADSIPTILDNLIHQTSRRQLQLALLDALDRVTSSSNQAADDNSDQQSRSRQQENLSKAIQAAGVHDHDLEYWDSIRQRASGDGPEAGPINVRRDLDPTKPLDPTKEAPKLPSGEDDGEDVQADIKGLTDDAGIFDEPHVGNTGVTNEQGDEEEKAPDATEKDREKGKGRA